MSDDLEQARSEEATRVHLQGVLRETLPSALAFYKFELRTSPFSAMFRAMQHMHIDVLGQVAGPIAVELALPRFKRVTTQMPVGRHLSELALSEIEKIIKLLSWSEARPNKPEEIERIRRVCQSGRMVQVKAGTVDLAVEGHDGELFLFALKATNPSCRFKEYKRTLLKWVAIVLAENPNARINTAIAIPYNPSAPEVYCRAGVSGMLDIRHELYVAEEFWDFLGGSGTFERLLVASEQMLAEFSARS